MSAMAYLMSCFSSFLAVLSSSSIRVVISLKHTDTQNTKIQNQKIWVRMMVGDDGKLRFERFHKVHKEKKKKLS